MKCRISFQSYFSPSLPFQVPEAVFLFVQDLQEVDDAFEIPWFWAKDPKGLERLGPADMHVLGLSELRQSKIFLETRRLDTTGREELRFFHEIFGFAADSIDIPRFLDLPVASIEWDGAPFFICGLSRFNLLFFVGCKNVGDENGPLTPWESFTSVKWDGMHLLSFVIYPELICYYLL